MPRSGSLWNAQPYKAHLSTALYGLAGPNAILHKINTLCGCSYSTGISSRRPLLFFFFLLSRAALDASYLSTSWALFYSQ